MTAEFVVADPVMVRLLTHQDGVACLGAFLEQDRSVAETARLQDKPLARVHYWVRRLHGAGLLTVVAEEARAGRPIKRYRAIAGRFRVPAALLPVDHFERMMTQIGRELTANLTAATDMPSHDLTVSPSTDGGVSVDRMPDPGQAFRLRPMQTAMGGIYLTKEQAQDFRHELTELHRRFQEASNRHAEDAEPYLVHLAMVPRRSQ